MYVWICDSDLMKIIPTLPTAECTKTFHNTPTTQSFSVQSIQNGHQMANQDFSTDYPRTCRHKASCFAVFHVTADQTSAVLREETMTHAAAVKKLRLA